MARGRLVLPLQRWLLLSHVLVFVLPWLALVGSGALRKDLEAQTQEDLAHQGALLRLFIERELSQGGDLPGLAAALSPLLAAAKAETLAGLRVVDAAGVVVASSGDAVGDDLSDESEVVTALGGETALVLRPRGETRYRSAPLGGPSRRADVRVHLALPLRQQQQIVGALVLSRTPREELQAFLQMAPRLSAGLALALGGTVALAVAAGLVLSRSLTALAAASLRVAQGQQTALQDVEPALESRVAEARELARALVTMSGRLQRRLGYIREFAGNVSHEFKTPVSALRGTIELLRDDEEMPPAQRLTFLDNALHDLDRLSRLVGGLLRLARAEEGGDRRVIELEALLDEALRAHPGVVRRGQSGRVEGSHEQLGSVVKNLVENARQHGGSAATIEVCGHISPGQTGFDVIDDGPGISPANLPRIFDRFFTTDRSEGTGLGLALVKAICEAHGGSVTVQSAPGRTVFSVRLPAA
jgi:signal transduction histidine kinase